MRPTALCPYARQWYAQNHDENSTNFSLTFEGIMYSGPRYEENRVTIHEVRGITTPERHQAEGNDSGHGPDCREVLDPEALFMSEDGKMKPFRLFCKDDWLFHVHGGLTERTPSANVLMRDKSEQSCYLGDRLFFPWIQ